MGLYLSLGILCGIDVFLGFSHLIDPVLVVLFVLNCIFGTDLGVN